MRTLDAGRPVPVSETVIFRVLSDSSLPVTAQGLRRELDYLEEKALVKLTQRTTPTWAAELSGHGIDVVEYATEAPTGINRPNKWW
jgi:hypothetical protein